MKLTQNQRLHWLWLIRSENMSVSARQKTPSPPYPNWHVRAANRQSVLPPLPMLKGKWFLPKKGVRFVAIGKPDYSALFQIDSSALFVAVKGSSGTLNRQGNPIVGSAQCIGCRHTSCHHVFQSAGKNRFQHHIRFCPQYRCGSAQGKSWHRHNCRHGKRDYIYPPKHHTLYQEILARDSVFVSEMPIGWEPRARDFPRRNRLIAGIALGLLVVECAQTHLSVPVMLLIRSGLSLAIPGSPLDPRAAGATQPDQGGRKPCGAP